MVRPHELYGLRHPETYFKLADGREVRVRPIRPGDEANLRDLFHHLSAEDVRRRYMQYLTEMPKPLAERLTHIDYGREMAFLAFEPGEREAVGVVRFSADCENRRAEFAIVIRPDFRRRGLGKNMLLKLIEFARARGIQVLFGEVLRENEPMLQLCRRLGFDVVGDPDEPGVCEVTLHL
jgi:acetyltransferase